MVYFIIENIISQNKGNKVNSSIYPQSIVYPNKDCKNNGTQLAKCFKNPRNHNKGIKIVTFYNSVSLLPSLMMTCDVRIFLQCTTSLKSVPAKCSYFFNTVCH